MSHLSLLSLVVLAPMLLAWNGGGSGNGTWSGVDGLQPVPLSAVVRVDDTARVVLSLPAGEGGDALVFVTASADRLGLSTRLPAPGMAVAFREYGPDGRLRAGAEQAAAGEVTIARGHGQWTVSLDVVWHLDGTGHVVRALHGARVGVEGPDLARGEPAASGGVGVSSGCDDSVAPEPEPASAMGSGCDGDDWSDGDDDSDEGGSDEGWSDGADGWGDDPGDDSTGCEGDEVGSEWGDDSGSGCEGDDVGSSSDAPSCEGDAIAAAGQQRRSPTVVRLINQLPWVMVLLGIRLAQRRRRSR